MTRRDRPQLGRRLRGQARGRVRVAGFGVGVSGGGRARAHAREVRQTIAKFISRSIISTISAEGRMVPMSFL